MTRNCPLPEWPSGLPSDEAAYVFEMHLALQKPESSRQQRRHFQSTAAACHHAIESISACPTAFMAFPLSGEPGNEDRLFALLQQLQVLAVYCEEAARGKRGRPPDTALKRLIRIKYHEFQKETPGRKGYWKDPAGQYAGRFLEQMEATLERLGFPYSSREALGAAIERALTTP